jgi:hypothetical protein
VATAALTPGKTDNTKPTIEQAAAVVPIEDDESAAKADFPGLTKCVNSLKRSHPVVTLQKLFSVR